MNWPEYFFGLAAHVATKSKDPSTKVGALIVDRHNAVVSAGFNGLPKGLSDAVVHDREMKLKRVIHAEHNALIFADHARLAGATLYITFPPCERCAAMICQYHALYGPLAVAMPPLDPGSSWADSQDEALRMFAEAGVRTITRG
jgi:dCMP deaminase